MVALVVMMCLVRMEGARLFVVFDYCVMVSGFLRSYWLDILRHGFISICDNDCVEFGFLFLSLY